MRITNGIINNNTKTNILVNKEYSDKYNTMVATGQKITRPSDDPIIAIRALRLNNNINEIDQYHGKNIPDAEAWLEITQTALEQTEGVLEDVQKYLTQGASDDNTAEDRKNILENLKGLRDQIYSAGNADYAGRTVFTGYRTSEPLTFMKDEKQLYTMVQKLSCDDYEEIKYISGAYNYDPNDLSNSQIADFNQNEVKNITVTRLRLAYDNLTREQNGKGSDGSDVPLSKDFTIRRWDEANKQYVNLFNTTVQVKHLGTDTKENDKLYMSTSDGGYLGDDDVFLIADTGELIMGKNAAAQMRKEGSEVNYEYARDEWEKNDRKPEHYFMAKTYDDDNKRLIEYNYNYNEEKKEDEFLDRKIQYEIAYNQKIEINVNADEVYSTYITRDVDELINVTYKCQESYEYLQKVKALRDKEGIPKADKDKLDSMYDAAQKEYDLYKEKMQKTFSKSITIFKGYTNDLDNKISAMGSLSNRVDLTKARVSDQLENFKELADQNINVELTESAIDLKNAELALQAAQQAASKVATTTLLNYL